MYYLPQYSWKWSTGRSTIPQPPRWQRGILANWITDAWNWWQSFEDSYPNFCVGNCPTHMLSQWKPGTWAFHRLKKWSVWWEPNPRNQLGRLTLYRWVTDALKIVEESCGGLEPLQPSLAPPWWLEHPSNVRWIPKLVAPAGFEPTHKESESSVLPDYTKGQWTQSLKARIYTMNSTAGQSIHMYFPIVHAGSRQCRIVHCRLQNCTVKEPLFLPLLECRQGTQSCCPCLCRGLQWIS